MGESLIALQDCSLIGLEDSPKLLREGLLQDGELRLLLWDSSDALNRSMQQLKPAATAAVHRTSVLDGAIVCDDSLMQDSFGLTSGMLPDISESPAIIGKLPPRARYRRKARAAATENGRQQQAAAAAASDKQLLGGSTALARKQLHSDSSKDDGDSQLCTASKAAQMQRQRQNQPNKENQQPGACAANTAQQVPAAAKLGLLQQLLDDSSCSASSYLPSSLALLQADLSIAAVAAAQVGCEQAAGHTTGYVDDSCSDLGASTGSNMTGFQGFWPAGLAANDAAAKVLSSSGPASPTLLFSAAMEAGKQNGVSGSQDDSTADGAAAAVVASGDGMQATPAAVADGSGQQHQQQQGWDQLLLLLSLDDSVAFAQSAGQGACAPNRLLTVPEQQQQHEEVADVSQADAAAAESAAREQYVGIAAEDDSASPPASPHEVATSPAASMLEPITPAGALQHSQGGWECHESCDSPHVLMSSPEQGVLMPVGEVTVKAADAAADTPAEAAQQVETGSKFELYSRDMGPKHMQQQHASSVAVAAADSAQAFSIQDLAWDGSQCTSAHSDGAGNRTRSSMQSIGWMLNNFDYSPIKGVTLAGTDALHICTPPAADRSCDLHQQYAEQQQSSKPSLLHQLLNESSESWQGPLLKTPVFATSDPGNVSNMACEADGPPSGQCDISPQMRMAVSLEQDHYQQQQQKLRLLVQSSAESIDSFAAAAAGKPYNSISSSRCSTGGTNRTAEGQQQQPGLRRSHSWSAFEGLGALVSSSLTVASTPASVICKNGWGIGGHSAVVRGLVDRLAMAELRCTQQQQKVVQAQHVALEKELQLQLLQRALAASEAEGSSALEALAAAMDLAASAGGSSSRRCSLDGAAATVQNMLPVSTADSAYAEQGKPTGDTSAPAAALQLKAGVRDAWVQTEATNSDKAGPAELQQQLQKQNVLLQEHNAAMQCTMAEAAQQLDILEARTNQLAAEKQAAEQQLLELKQKQLAEQHDLHQSELDEQQQQHEEEVRGLHDRLSTLQAELASKNNQISVLNLQVQGVRQQEAEAQQLAKDLRDDIQDMQGQIAGLERQLTAKQTSCNDASRDLMAARASVSELEGQLSDRKSNSTAATEQLQRQVQQLMAASEELQQANVRLRDGESEAAANQMSLSSKNTELTAQLQEATAINKQLLESNSHLQAQTASLSAICQALKAQGASELSAQHASATALATTPAGPANAAAAQGAATGEAVGPTPMRRRMAAANAQLERRCQELMEQKQQVVQQLQQQQGELQALQQQQQQGVGHIEPPDAACRDTAAIAAATALAEQQVVIEELQAQVQHFIDCNEEILGQLEGLEAECNALQDEKERLLGTCSTLEEQNIELKQQLLKQQQACKDAAAHKVKMAAAVSAGLQTHVGPAVPAEPDGANSTNTALYERCQELQQQLVEQHQQHEELTAALQSKCKHMSSKIEPMQQQLLSLQAEHSSLAAAYHELKSKHSKVKQDCSELSRQLLAAKETESRVIQELQKAERAGDKLQGQNAALIEQLVQLQLVQPGDRGRPAGVSQGVQAVSTAATASAAVQANMVATNTTAAAVQSNSSTAAGVTTMHSSIEPIQQRKRWTSDFAVQVDLGPSPEQATAVQQLLLLQAQQQLQDMEQQNKQAADRLLDSKQRMASLQHSIQQQEGQTKAAEANLAEATKLHQQQSAALQAENNQLVKQLADTRVQLHSLQTVNKQLEACVASQQDKLQQQAAALKQLQQQVLDLQHQRNLDKVQLASAASELDQARTHAQQLLASKEQDTKAVAALQRQVQQLQLEVQQQQQQQQQKEQAAARADAAAAAAAAQVREQVLQGELRSSKQQAQLLLSEKESLAAELQQTKVAIDFLEDSVRRLGQHNASLVQQLQEMLASGAAASTINGNSNGNSIMGDDVAAAAAGSSGAAAGAVSPRTLHSIIAAATRVNEKNKRLKRKIQEMQAESGAKIDRFRMTHK